MSMDRRLAGLPRDPFSFEPRFHPPGRHPATHRLRLHAENLEELRGRLTSAGMDTTVCVSALDHTLGLIAAFEERESEEKQRTLRMLEA